MGDGDEAAVRVPFRIHTRRGVLEASVRTTEAPIPVVDVEIRLDNPRARLKPGQPVRVEVSVADAGASR